MFSVSSPALLLGLLCLIIPILIHLFNKSRGRLVKVGSIELLRKLKTSQVRQVKIYRWLLLILRLCIFALATLLIAELWFNSTAIKDNNRQVLVSKPWLKYAQQDEIERLFSRHKNDEIYLLGQKQLALTPHLANTYNADLSSEKPFAIWPDIHQHINALKINQPMSIYITNEVPLTELTSVERIKPNISAQQAKQIDWQIKSIIDDATSEHVSTFTVAIYQQENRNITPLLTALEAIQRHTISSLSISVLNNEQLESVQAEVLFYLADTPLPDYLIERINQGMVVIKDNTVIGQNITSNQQTFVQQGQFNIVSTLELLAQTKVFRYVSASSQSTITHQTDQQALTPVNAFWSLSNGAQLLAINKFGLGKVIEFSSRFEPLWFGLTKQAEFPSVLTLLLSEHTQLKQYQNIKIEQSQLQLAHNGIDKQYETNMVTKQPLFHYLALLLVCFWLLERVLSEKYYRG